MPTQAAIVQGLQGFALAAALLLALIAAVFWSRRQARPSWGLGWLGLAFACGAVINLPPLYLAPGQSVYGSAFVWLLIPVGLTGVGALTVGLRRFAGDPVPRPGRALLGVAAWLLLSATALRLLGAGELGGHIATALIYLWLLWICRQAGRADPGLQLGWVSAMLWITPVGVVLAALLGMDPNLLRHAGAVPFSMLGIALLLATLARYHQELAGELQRRERAEAELRQLNLDLERRIELRTEELRDMVGGLESFNRMVSHDLRGPLGGLKGLSALALQALDAGDAARARRMLDLMHQESERLVQLVHDLLTLARVNHTELALRPTPLDAVLDEALDMLALSEGDALRARVQREHLPTAQADGALLRQVFVNLLSNAVKFSGGGADVQVRVRGDEQPGEVVVEVRDHGRGFPPERAAELFQPFRRLHGEEVPGTGVGLTIVRRVIERHGGRVWAEGRPGQGASFFFTLPAVERG